MAEFLEKCVLALCIFVIICLVYYLIGKIINTEKEVCEMPTAIPTDITEHYYYSGMASQGKPSAKYYPEMYMEEPGKINESSESSNMQKLKPHVAESKINNPQYYQDNQADSMNRVEIYGQWQQNRPNFNILWDQARKDSYLRESPCGRKICRKIEYEFQNQ